MSLVGFELTFSAGERPQTYNLGRAATGAGDTSVNPEKYLSNTHLPSACITNTSVNLDIP